MRRALEMWTSALQMYAARPMRRLRRQVPLLDRLLQVGLDAREFEAVSQACARSGERFGAYYHWYLQKLLVARRVRNLDRDAMLAMVARMDRSDYAPLDAACAHDGGLVLAIPHHGHYILSIVALLEQLRHRREVFVFYGSPTTHAGNDVFDRLHECLYREPGSGTHVIHDDRAGLARALRGLHDGAAVIIMPDAYRNERETYALPFCGRPLNAMLGTAAMARKTRSAVLPVVSQPAATRLEFRSVFSACIEPPADAASGAPEDVVHADYRATAAMFRDFERTMGDSILHWQHARTHYARRAAFPELDPEALQRVAELFFDDPRVCVDLGHPLRLD